MQNRVRDEQQGFAGGLNLSAEEDLLAPDEVRTAVNARLSTRGAIKKRLGTKRTHAAALAAAVYGGYSFRQSTGATLELVTTNDGKLYSGTYGIPMTWTLVGTLTNTTYPSFAQFRDATDECVYIVNAGGSAHSLAKYKAGVLTNDLAGTPTVLNRLAVQNQRLFAVTGYDQTLWYSALNNGDTLGIDASGGGSQIVRTFGDQNITALVALGSSLLMFHKTGISKFTGYGQGDITIASGTRGLAQDTGTIAPDSIVTIENVCFFLSDRGWYQATEFEVKPIGEKVETLISVTSQFGTASVGIKSAHSPLSQEVMWFIPGTGVYVYNYRLQAWSGPFNGTIFADSTAGFWQTLDSSSQPIVLIGGSDGFVRRMDLPTVFKDDVLSDGTGGSAFSMSVRCHRMYFGNRASEKAFRFIFITGDTDGATATGVAFDSDVLAGGSVSLSAAFANQRSQRIQAWGRGQYSDITLFDASSNAIPAFSHIAVQAADYGERF